jgi:excisionase family DNA binding protein
MTESIRLDKDWLTLKEVAAYLRVCEGTVFRYLKFGKLKGRQMVPKGSWRISSASVEQLLKQGKELV